MTNRTDNLAAFVLSPGFKLELVAKDPVMANPIAMTFDADGRLFVLETTEEAPVAEVRTGRVRLLEDTAGYGVYESSSVYADNLVGPLALACYNGGIFVASAGEILYLKDTNHAGMATVSEVVFKTFGDQTNGASGQVTITGLAWGLDNRIHATTPSLGGDVISSSTPAQSLILSSGNFSFDPRSKLLRAESGSGTSGLAFDDRGRKFVSTPMQHIEGVMYDAIYSGRNAFFSMPDPVVDLAGNGNASLIYPAPPRLPANAVRVPVAPLHFTDAGGLAIYRGNAFPANYVGDAFTVDAKANVVHRDKLRQQSVELVAERPADETTAEFLAVRDNSFEPRQVINGPDGALYLAGVLRENTSAKTNGKTNALTTVTHGRIYRIVPVNFKRTKLTSLSEATGDQLVLQLRHPNGWQRDTAARLLYERQDKTTVAPLVKLLYDLQTPPLARMHALHVLDGLQVTAQGKSAKAFGALYALKALFDPDDRVREHGVLLSERFMGGPTPLPDQLWSQLSNMASDVSPDVRYQLAFTLGQSHHEGVEQPLAALLRTDLTNRWMQAAILSGLNNGAARMFDLVIGDTALRRSTSGQEFLRNLIFIIGGKNQSQDIALAIRDLSQIPEAAVAFSLARALDNTLQRGNGSLYAADNTHMLRDFYLRATRVALDDTADTNARVLALQVINSVSADPSLASGLIWGWNSRQPWFRSEAMVTLLSRPERIPNLISELGTGLVPRSDLTYPQIRFLLAYPDITIRQQAGALLTVANPGQRQKILNQFSTALQTQGNAIHGRQIFLARCGMCHVFGGDGNSGGLKLAATPKNSQASLLAQIITPNANPSTSNTESLIATKDGQTLTGFVTEQTPGSVTLYQDNGVRRVVARSNIQALTGLGFSAMPEELEKGLSLQDMGDLLGYLTGQ